MSDLSVWCLSGGLPCGGRNSGEPGLTSGSWWVDLCVLGQHLRKGYREDEIHQLTAALAPRLGLCPACLGFGTPADLPLRSAAALDEVPGPCAECTGSGRPFIQVTIIRSGHETRGEMSILPHELVPPRPGTIAACLACGISPDEHDRVPGGTATEAAEAADDNAGTT